MQLNSKSIFLRRVREAQLLKKISKRTANHFISVYKKFFKKNQRPSRSAFAGTGLALGAKVEIECWAIK